MATYTDITINQDTGIGSGKIDGILFSSVNLAEGSFPVSQPKVAPVNSIFDPSGNQTNKALIINAVDIDWNGAKPEIGETSDGITTTGELLTLIKKYADTTVKNSLIGASTDASTANTIWGAKNYAQDQANQARNDAREDAKEYVDTTAKDNLIGTTADTTIDTHWGVKNSLIGTSDDEETANTIWGAKKHADNIENIVTAQADLWSRERANNAKTEAISEAKKYTDSELAKLQTRVEALEKAFSTLAQNVGALVTITNGDQT